jgi:hypothetical protein
MPTIKLQVLQIMPANNWYALMDYRLKDGRLRNDNLDYEMQEIPVVAFALCRYRNVNIDHHIGEDGFKNGYEERYEEHWNDCVSFVRPILQDWAETDGGCHGAPYEPKSELGKIVNMYKGKGKHGLVTLRFDGKLEVANDSIDNLKHQRNLVCDGIVNIAMEMGIIHKDASPSGAEVLMLIDNILETIKKGETT